MVWYLSYMVVYFLFMFSLGIYYFLKVKSSQDYLIAGWNMGFWSIVGTIVSTFCGAAVFIGWVGMGFTVGLSGFFQFALPAVVFSILLIIVFAKPLRRQKLYTIADLFSERFGKTTGVIPSVLSAFVYSVPTLALQMVGMTTVFTIAFGMEVSTGLIVAFVLILGFTILGGLPATIITDAIQSVIIIVGIIALFIASIFYSGGFKDVVNNTPSEYLTPVGPDGLVAVLLFALSVGPFYIIWQSTWQRIFASKTEKVARKAGVTGFLIAGVVSVLPYSIGVIARNYVPVDMNPDLLFSYVTAEVLPPYLGGIVLVGLLAALMTGATSFILQGSSNLTVDLYKRLFNVDASEKKMMIASRVTVAIISILGLLVAFNLTDIVSVYQWALRLSAATLVFPFLAIMFWKRVTKTGVQISMIMALIATIIYPYLGLTLDHTIFGLTTSLISLIIISLLTRHAASEQVRAVFWEDLLSAKNRV
ncbi:sodium:solute symporter family protein [Halobacillus halophilus]|uniref:sodium:solute symporter family protein n=1 Tax=Halobacillus halophilus TaxID=1570 RepID=UPI001CD4AA9D|nr:sodium:solute symporter family protein [Halobacillus halophilus]MCA1010713.1 sodium:solute symporter family protein [Halobacillus halophilus]